MIRYMSKNAKLASLNCGYALLTQTGETLHMTSKADKFHQF